MTETEKLIAFLDDVPERSRRRICLDLDDENTPEELRTAAREVLERDGREEKE